MTLDKTAELIDLQVSLGSGYNRNAVQIILAEVKKEHGQDAVDKLIRENSLDEIFGLQASQEIYL